MQTCLSSAIGFACINDAGEACGKGTLIVYCHAAGTAGLNVPMFIALRRFTLLCTIVLERFMMGKKHDRSTIGAVGIMIGGAP